jgi:hypothetical protein
MKGKLSISCNLFKYFEHINIGRSFHKERNNYQFLIENNISPIRYFPGDGYNSILENSFKIKISKRKPKQYFDRPQVATYTTEQFFFHFQFKKRFTLNRNI